MTRLEKLTIELQKIAEKHKDEIQNLRRSGVNGGINAKHIDGWSRSPNGTITRSANMTSNLPVMRWWDGCLPTPSSAIPHCCVNEAYESYKQIFNKDK